MSVNTEHSLLYSLLEYGEIDDYTKIKDKWFESDVIRFCIKECRDYIKKNNEAPVVPVLYYPIEKKYGTESANTFMVDSSSSKFATFSKIGIVADKLKEEYGERERIRKAQETIDNGGKKKERSKPVERSNKLTIPKGLPYAPLGYDRDKIYLIPKRCQQIYELNTGSLNKRHLISIAPLSYWESAYMGERGADWDMACSDVVSQCKEFGLYDVAKTRGRGVWSEEGSVVINLGNKLVIDGQSYSHSDHLSNYNYELALPLSASDFTDKMTQVDCQGVFEVVNSLSWDNSIYGRYFAGWLVSAVICGGLDWRPHMWLTGTRGSGKSWVLKNIVSPLVGEFAVYPQGETTEAGLRQTLSSDALSVVFDEAEGENKKGKQRIEDILQLARQSSSETGGKIIKGSAGGSSRTFCIRSSFLFASIGIAMTNSADESRVNIVSLKANDNNDESQAKFEKLDRIASMRINTDTGKKFRALVISLLPVIKENIKTMQKACCDFTADRRSADQIGTLLACSLVFETSSILTYDEAYDWCSKLDWSEHQEDRTLDDADEDRCLEYIMHSLVRNEDNKERSILDLCRRSHFDRTAKDILERRGLRYREGCIIVANRSPLMAKMLEETSWHSNWGKTLKRIKNATPRGGFKMNNRSVRVVEIPYDIDLEYPMDDSNDVKGF